MYTFIFSLLCNGLSTVAKDHNLNSIALEVYFYNNTPVLNVDILFARFRANRPNITFECHLTHLDFGRHDCKYSSNCIMYHLICINQMHSFLECHCMFKECMLNG